MSLCPDLCPTRAHSRAFQRTNAFEIRGSHIVEPARRSQGLLAETSDAGDFYDRHPTWGDANRAALDVEGLRDRGRGPAGSLRGGAGGRGNDRTERPVRRARRAVATPGDRRPDVATVRRQRRTVSDH